MRLPFLFIFIIVLFPRLIFAEPEYTFDLDEIEKKPYSFGGYLEARPVLLGFDKDAAFYRLKLYIEKQYTPLENYIKNKYLIKKNLFYLILALNFKDF